MRIHSVYIFSDIDTPRQIYQQLITISLLFGHVSCQFISIESSKNHFSAVQTLPLVGSLQDAWMRLALEGAHSLPTLIYVLVKTIVGISNDQSLSVMLFK